MRYLLDTCTFLWMLSADERLGRAARNRILDPASELLLSAASSWEIAIKFSLGRLKLPEPPENYVPSRMERSSIDGLPIDHAHALATTRLPEHHRDPFDRLLIAQALTEGLTILTPDPSFAAYQVDTEW